MSKYTLMPAFAPVDGTSEESDRFGWAKVLLTALAHASASTGTRKFLLRPESVGAAREPEQGLVVWLFTVRTAFTASSASVASVLDAQTTDALWKGSKLLYRLATPQDEVDGQIEGMPIPPFVYTAVVRMLAATNGALHPTTRVPFPATSPQAEVWQSGFLATPHYTPSP